MIRCDKIRRKHKNQYLKRSSFLIPHPVLFLVVGKSNVTFFFIFFIFFIFLIDDDEIFLAGVQSEVERIDIRVVGDGVGGSGKFQNTSLDILK